MPPPPTPTPNPKARDLILPDFSSEDLQRMEEEVRGVELPEEETTPSLPPSPYPTPSPSPSPKEKTPLLTPFPSSSPSPSPSPRPDPSLTPSPSPSPPGKRQRDLILDLPDNLGNLDMASPAPSPVPYIPPAPSPTTSPKVRRASDVGSPAEARVIDPAIGLLSYPRRRYSNGALVYLPREAITGLNREAQKRFYNFLQSAEIELGGNVQPEITAAYENSGHSENSLHYHGLAIDVEFFTPSGKKLTNIGKKLKKIAERYGLYFLDEYENPTPHTTGGHYHIALPDPSKPVDGPPPGPPNKYRVYTWRYALEDRIDRPDILYRQWGVESAFIPHAQSPAGAYGITQIMPGTLNELLNEFGGQIKKEDFYKSPAIQIKLGTRYMRRMLEKFGNYPQALAAYNAGPGAVEEALHGYRNLPQETINYVAHILDVDPDTARRLILDKTAQKGKYEYLPQMADKKKMFADPEVEGMREFAKHLQAAMLPIHKYLQVLALPMMVTDPRLGYEFMPTPEGAFEKHPQLEEDQEKFIKATYVRAADSFLLGLPSAFVSPETFSDLEALSQWERENYNRWQKVFMGGSNFLLNIAGTILTMEMGVPLMAAAAKVALPARVVGGMSFLGRATEALKTAYDAGKLPGPAKSLLYFLSRNWATVAGKPGEYVLTEAFRWGNLGAAVHASRSLAQQMIQEGKSFQEAVPGAVFDALHGWVSWFVVPYYLESLFVKSRAQGAFWPLFAGGAMAGDPTGLISKGFLGGTAEALKAGEDIGSALKEGLLEGLTGGLIMGTTGQFTAPLLVGMLGMTRRGMAGMADVWSRFAPGKEYWTEGAGRVRQKLSEDPGARLSAKDRFTILMGETAPQFVGKFTGILPRQVRELAVKSWKGTYDALTNAEKNILGRMVSSFYDYIINKYEGARDLARALIQRSAIEKEKSSWLVQARTLENTVERVSQHYDYLKKQMEPLQQELQNLSNIPEVLRYSDLTAQVDAARAGIAHLRESLSREGADATAINKEIANLEAQVQNLSNEANALRNANENVKRFSEVRSDLEAIQKQAQELENHPAVANRDALLVEAERMKKRAEVLDRTMAKLDEAVTGKKRPPVISETPAPGTPSPPPPAPPAKKRGRGGKKQAGPPEPGEAPPGEGGEGGTPPGEGGGGGTPPGDGGGTPPGEGGGGGKGPGKEPEGPSGAGTSPPEESVRPNVGDEVAFIHTEGKGIVKEIREDPHQPDDPILVLESGEAIHASAVKVVRRAGEGKPPAPAGKKAGPSKDITEVIDFASLPDEWREFLLYLPVDDLKLRAYKSLKRKRPIITLWLRQKPNDLIIFDLAQGEPPKRYWFKVPEGETKAYLNPNTFDVSEVEWNAIKRDFLSGEDMHAIFVANEPGKKFLPAAKEPPPSSSAEAETVLTESKGEGIELPVSKEGTPFVDYLLSVPRVTAGTGKARKELNVIAFKDIFPEVKEKFGIKSKDEFAKYIHNLNRYMATPEGKDVPVRLVMASTSARRKGSYFLYVDENGQEFRYFGYEKIKPVEAAPPSPPSPPSGEGPGEGTPPSGEGGGVGEGTPPGKEPGEVPPGTGEKGEGAGEGASGEGEGAPSGADMDPLPLGASVLIDDYRPRFEEQISRWRSHFDKVSDKLKDQVEERIRRADRPAFIKHGEVHTDRFRILWMDENGDCLEQFVSTGTGLSSPHTVSYRYFIDEMGEDAVRAILSDPKYYGVINAAGLGHLYKEGQAMGAVKEGAVHDFLSEFDIRDPERHLGLIYPPKELTDFLRSKVSGSRRSSPARVLVKHDGAGYMTNFTLYSRKSEGEGPSSSNIIAEEFTIVPENEGKDRRIVKVSEEPVPEELWRDIIKQASKDFFRPLPEGRSYFINAPARMEFLSLRKEKASAPLESSNGELIFVNSPVLVAGVSGRSHTRNAEEALHVESLSPIPTASDKKLFSFPGIDLSLGVVELSEPVEIGATHYKRVPVSLVVPYKPGREVSRETLRGIMPTYLGILKSQVRELLAPDKVFYARNKDLVPRKVDMPSEKAKLIRNISREIVDKVEEYQIEEGRPVGKDFQNLNLKKFLSSLDFLLEVNRGTADPQASSWIRLKDGRMSLLTSDGKTIIQNAEATYMSGLRPEDTIDVPIHNDDIIRIKNTLRTGTHEVEVLEPQDMYLPVKVDNRLYALPLFLDPVPLQEIQNYIKTFKNESIYKATILPKTAATKLEFLEEILKKESRRSPHSTTKDVARDRKTLEKEGRVRLTVGGNSNLVRVTVLGPGDLSFIPYNTARQQYKVLGTMDVPATDIISKTEGGLGGIVEIDFPLGVMIKALKATKGGVGGVDLYIYMPETEYGMKGLVMERARKLENPEVTYVATAFREAPPLHVLTGGADSP